MVYNANDKTLYASTTADGDGVLYTINPATLEATEFNTDPDDYWYGIADLLVTSDNQILGTLWYKNPEAAGLVQFSLLGEFIPQALFSIQDICCGMGMVFGDNDAELVSQFSSCDAILGWSRTVPLAGNAARSNYASPKPDGPPGVSWFRVSQLPVSQLPVSQLPVSQLPVSQLPAAS